MFVIDSHAVRQNFAGPQRTQRYTGYALPYNVFARPKRPQNRAPPTAATDVNFRSSSLAGALTQGITARDPYAGAYTQVSNTTSYKQEISLTDALNPAFVRKVFQAATPTGPNTPPAIVPSTTGAAMPVHQAQLPVVSTPAQTVMSAFAPTPGLTNGSSPEGGSPYHDPRTPPNDVGHMDPSRYTQHIQPHAMPLAEQTQPYHAMNSGVAAVTPEPYNQKFHPAQIVGTTTIEPGGGNNQLLAPETAAATPNTPRQSGTAQAETKSKERWEAFLLQFGTADSYTFRAPFVDGNFGVALTIGDDEKGTYRAKIHEHRNFENTLPADVRFEIANLRRRVEWQGLQPAERPVQDPLSHYEIIDEKGKRYRCPLCHESLQHAARALYRHVEGEKHLAIHFLYAGRTYYRSPQKAWEGTMTRGDFTKKDNRVFLGLQEE
ncbi:unnamed protein product [Peniophora sp. CBMAI 1063]|nr:unnamed protein product [Peniophora sp. CBMAI 1063]